jgi:ribosome modulation factor
MKPPRGFETWNRALRGAYRKGHETGLNGLAATSCPYIDKRKQSGRLTWSRGFITAWHDGWKAGDGQRKQNAITAYYKDRADSGDSPLEARRP